MAQTIPSLRDLMAAGAHFGHKRERSHPKAKNYIYTLREGIYIIDLEKTRDALEKALAVVTDLAQSGKTVLFVGTKPQASDLVKAAAERAGMPYIVNHWPGGLLTNFETSSDNLKRIVQMESKIADNSYANLTKKERRVIGEKVRKSNEILGGVKGLTKMPDALFVVDVVAEGTAIKEAYRLGIPVIGLCDTNANPETVDYPIPANDDARKTIEMIVNLVADTISSHRAAPAVKAEAPKAEVKTDKPVAVATPEVAEVSAATPASVEAAPAVTEEKPKRARAKKADEKTEEAAA